MKAISPGKSNRHLHRWQRETNCKGFWSSGSSTASLQLTWRNSATNNTAKQECMLYPVPVQVFKCSLIFKGTDIMHIHILLSVHEALACLRLVASFLLWARLLSQFQFCHCFDKERWPNSLRLKFKTFIKLHHNDLCMDELSGLLNNNNGLKQNQFFLDYKQAAILLCSLFLLHLSHFKSLP